MESYEIFWKKALEKLQSSMSQVGFSAWIEPLKAIDLDEGFMILEATTTFIANRAMAMSAQICAALKETADISDFKVYIAGESTPFFSSKKEDELEDSTSPIDEKNTFDNFVVGSSNRFLHAAAKAVSDNPGKSYNPLFIYGGSGLGKTHMMHAIANRIKQNSPSLKVLYVTCEKFTNDFIHSIKQGKGYASGRSFSDRYRTCDVLIIDDVQFLAKKSSTQEEFFHTFNELYGKKKQIVLSADCSPKDIEELEERLVTRFQSGLMAEVLPPDIETKIAILQKKAEEQKYVLKLEVAEFLAENGGNNVRSLEGLLTKVIFASLLKEEPLSIEIAKEAMRMSSTTDKPEEQVISIDQIIAETCKYFSISKDDIRGKSKKKEIAEPRQICAYIITDLLPEVPLESIGKALGGRDHTTIMYARDKIAENRKNTPRIATAVDDIINLVMKK